MKILIVSGPASGVNNLNQLGSNLARKHKIKMAKSLESAMEIFASEADFEGLVLPLRCPERAISPNKTRLIAHTADRLRQTHPNIKILVLANRHDIEYGLANALASHGLNWIELGDTRGVHRFFSESHE